MAKVVSFSSGKGGVGKTTLTANVGYALSRRGNRVLLIDADWTLGKLGLLFGARPECTIERVLSGERTLLSAIHPLSPRLGLIGSPSGFQGLEELTEAQRHQLFFEIDALGEDYDFVLLDHSSGINWGVLPFAAAAHLQLIVATPEPTSLTDAYAIMKVLWSRFRVRDFDLVLAQANDPKMGTQTGERFIAMAEKHLPISVHLREVIGWEPLISDSICRQRPFIETHPTSEFSKAVGRIANLMEQKSGVVNHGLRFFGGQSEDKYASEGQKI